LFSLRKLVTALETLRAALAAKAEEFAP